MYYRKILLPDVPWRQVSLFPCATTVKFCLRTPSVLKYKGFSLVLGQTMLSLIKFVEKDNNTIYNIK
jgi:hypothetical protein